MWFLLVKCVRVCVHAYPCMCHNEMLKQLVLYKSTISEQLIHCYYALSNITCLSRSHKSIIKTPRQKKESESNMCVCVCACVCALFS